jgi:hypothetical protein
MKLFGMKVRNRAFFALGINLLGYAWLLTAQPGDPLLHWLSLIKIIVWAIGAGFLGASLASE